MNDKYYTILTMGGSCNHCNHRCCVNGESGNVISGSCIHCNTPMILCTNTGDHPNRINGEACGCADKDTCDWVCDDCNPEYTLCQLCEDDCHPMGTKSHTCNVCHHDVCEECIDSDGNCKDCNGTFVQY
jgi:hypothetical protein